MRRYGRHYPAVLGLILYFAAVCLGIALMLLRPQTPGRLPTLVAWHCAGIVAGCLLFPSALALMRRRPWPPTFGGRVARQWPLAFFLLPGLAIRCLGAEMVFARPWLDAAFHFFSGWVAPAALSMFFNQVPFRRQGVWMGVALAAGWAMWRVFVSDACADFEHTPDCRRIVWALRVQAGLLAALTAVIVLGVARFHRHLSPPARRPGPDKARRNANIRRLALATLVYSVVAGVVYARLFPTYPTYFHHFFSGAYSLVLPVSPLIGLYLDWRKTAAFRRIALFCAIVFLFAPTMLMLSGEPPLYDLIYATVVVGQLALMIAFPVYLASQAGGGWWYCLVYCAVFAERGLGLSISWLMRNKIDFETGFVSFAATCGALLFYFLIKGVDFAETADTPPEKAERPEPEADFHFLEPFETPAEDKQSANDESIHSQVFDKYNLSPREREVSILLLKGGSTRDISQALGISEYTVKAHVRNILTKAGVPSRKAFLAVIIAESDS